MLWHQGRGGPFVRSTSRTPASLSPAGRLWPVDVGWPARSASNTPVARETTAFIECVSNTGGGSCTASFCHMAFATAAWRPLLLGVKPPAHHPLARLRGLLCWYPLLLMRPQSRTESRYRRSAPLLPSRPAAHASRPAACWRRPACSAQAAAVSAGEGRRLLGAWPSGKAAGNCRRAPI